MLPVDSRPTRVLAVGSGKGGVGKTTVAVYLALALAGKGQKVGLLDADLYSPNALRLMGLTRTTDATSFTLSERPDSAQARPQPIERYGIKVWSTQLLVGESQPLSLPAPFANLLLDRGFRDVNWGPLDWLVVDLPPGTGDIQQHVVAASQIDAALVVVTPQDLAHLDARKLCGMLNHAKVPIVGGVENMGPLSCPCCGTEIALYPPTPPRRTIWSLGVEQLASLPFSTALGRAANLGDPSQTDPALLETFTTLATTVLDRLPLG